MRHALPALMLLALASPSAAQPDPRVLSFTTPDKLVWKGDPKAGPQTVNLWGGPAKPGAYAILVRWPPTR